MLETCLNLIIIAIIYQKLPKESNSPKKSNATLLPILVQCSLYFLKFCASDETEDCYAMRRWTSFEAFRSAKLNVKFKSKNLRC